MKKIAPLLLLSCLSFGGFAAYHYNTTKGVKAACAGDKSCKVCKNCKYCKHCAKSGGTCGVCKR